MLAHGYKVEACCSLSSRQDSTLPATSLLSYTEKYKSSPELSVDKMSSSHQSTQPHAATIHKQTTEGRTSAPTHDHSSTKATDGSTISAATDQAAIKSRHGKIGLKSTGVNDEDSHWALKKWEEQTPGDEPWSSVSDRKA